MIKEKELKVSSLILFLLLIGMSSALFAQGLKADGKRIIDQNGTNIILRGMGLGGWMIQEGYMLETSSFANTQSKIKAKIEDLIGPLNTEAFYDAWLANHCTKKDIDSLAVWGFNSIRVPLHYNLFTLPIEKESVVSKNTWLSKGFTITDSLIKWCSEKKIYVILDLHGAPGGQGHDAAISDYDAAKPSLWESEANKQKTIALWGRLAERYANEPWVGGYDLINETNWNFTPGENPNGLVEASNTPLRQLYIDITNAIRKVDKKHIIFIEGNGWGNNYKGLFPLWDDNLVISFHKYWNYNDQNAIEPYLKVRNEYNVPIWLGESGENSNQWFTDAIQLVENNNIGWAWWPLKKINSIVGPLTIKKTDGYQALLSYWQNGGVKPSVESAKAALMQQVENLKIENCLFHKDVIDAMFRQVKDSATKPFALLKVPGIVAATDYDMGKNGKAYFDTDIATYHVNTGKHTSWNRGYAYRNDGVDIEKTDDVNPKSKGYNIGWTVDGEWMQYTLEVGLSANYDVAIRYAASISGSKIRLQVNGINVSNIVELPLTGTKQSWNDIVINNIKLLKGTQRLRLIFEKGGANIGFMQFSISKVN
ncbi:MAG: cellulase family glycosylhydrolase [Bacteroidetes bacterium]|nr:cellulase family glycosylhydrolase [Bacteroidota bacterium]